MPAGVDHTLAKQGEERIGIELGNFCRSEMGDARTLHEDLLDALRISI